MRLHTSTFLPLILSLVFLISMSAQAQSNDGQQRKRPTVVFKGSVADSATQAPLAFASVTFLKKSDSSFVEGTITDENGQYVLDITLGMYLMKVDYMGYTTLYLEGPKPEKGKMEYIIPAINMSADAQMLQEAVVEAEASNVTLTLEKKSFNVGEDMAAVGGSASDVLENIPSVTVDDDGTVALRGSTNVRILINGKQSGLVGVSTQDALELLNGDLIERVEVITNPSARYDAEGQAGIINIILKKEQKKGTNGVFSGSLMDPLGGNASATLNHRVGKWNFFGSYSYRNTQRLSISNEDRHTFETGEPESWLYQDGDYVRNRKSNSFQFGTDYNIDDKNMISFSGMYRVSGSENSSTILYTAADENQVEIGQSDRYNTEDESGDNFEFVMGYAKDYDNSKQKLTIDMSYSQSDEIEDGYAEQAMGYDDNGLPMDWIYQDTYNKEKMKNGVFQLDYSKPLKKGGLLDVGVKTSYRNIGTNYSVIEKEEGGEWVDLPEFTNSMNYDELIQAAYAMYSKEWTKWSFAGGVRAEYTYLNIDQGSDIEPNLKEYINPFPTAHLSYKVSDFTSWQVSYSKRIRRPGFWQLNPFFSYQNPVSFYSGNPDIDPEYTHSTELTYLFFKKKINVNASVYYRSSTGTFQYVRTYEDGVTYTSPMNANGNQSYGIELTSTYSPFSWWRITGTLNAYGNKLDASNLEQGDIRNYTSYNIQLSSMMRFPKLVNIQMRGFYNGPSEVAQGYVEGMGALDISLNRDIMNKKATVSFKVRDVFNSRQRQSETYGEDFYIYSIRKPAQPQYTLGFTYRLNNVEKNKRRKTAGQSMEMDME